MKYNLIRDECGGDFPIRVEVETEGRNRVLWFKTEEQAHAWTEQNL